MRDDGMCHQQPISMVFEQNELRGWDCIPKKAQTAEERVTHDRDPFGDRLVPLKLVALFVLVFPFVGDFAVVNTRIGSKGGGWVGMSRRRRGGCGGRFVVGGSG